MITTKKRPPTNSNRRQASEEPEQDSSNDVVWAARLNIVLSKQSATPHVNIKDQSGIIQALLRRAVDLGEVYLILGIPPDEENYVMTLDEAAAMHTPFSTVGLHHYALMALIHAAEEAGYSEVEGDIGHRLVNGSEPKYIKPLRTHVSYL